MFLGTLKIPIVDVSQEDSSQPLQGFKECPDVLVFGSCIRYSFLHSLGRVMCAGMNGYMKVSKFGRHHWASVSDISQSSSSGELAWVDGGESRSVSRDLNPDTSSSSGRR